MTHPDWSTAATLEDLGDVDVCKALTTAPAKSALIRRIERFLDTCTDEAGNHVYTDRNVAAWRCLRINYVYLARDDGLLSILIADYPVIMLPMFRSAALRALMHGDVHCQITHLPILDAVRALSSAHFHNLVKVRGTITHRTRVFPHLRRVIFSCSECASTLGSDARMFGACPSCGAPSPFFAADERAIYGRYQVLTLQCETAGAGDGDGDGDSADRIKIVLLRDLVGCVNEGGVVEVTGIYACDASRHYAVTGEVPMAIVANYVARAG